MLVASRLDAAGLSLAEAVPARPGWSSLETCPVLGGSWAKCGAPLLQKAPPGLAGSSGEASCHLWVLEESLTRADDLDLRWAARWGQGSPSEVIFLSRHASASGKPCLTVHPIGNPFGNPKGRQPGEGGGRQ